MIKWRLSASILLLTFAVDLYALTCSDNRKVILRFLRSHVAVKQFDEQLGAKTTENFIKSLDPGKVFFLESDIEEIKNKVDKKLHLDLAKLDCSGVDLIYSIYSKRFEERIKYSYELLHKDFDFSVDESLVIDRKNMPFPKDVAEANDRWRKRVKYQMMHLLGILSKEEAIKKVEKRYQLSEKRHKETNIDDIYSIFLDSFARSLDPHSSFMPPRQLEEFRIGTRLSFQGIGAVLNSEDGITKIQSLVPGGAAQKSQKIKIEDQIIAVSQLNAPPVDIIDMDLEDVVKLIRGPEGSEVRLTIRRGKESFIVPILREKIQLKDKQAKSKTYEIKTKEKEPSTVKIGVLDLPSFYMDFEGRQAHKEDFRSSSRDMQEQIEVLKKAEVDAIVLDLRGNGGGSLDEAINVAGLFVGEGPIVQIKGVTPQAQVSSYSGSAIYSGPLVVIIDRSSASASEILVGSIQDRKRGIVVGDDHTFGKGTVQNLNDLEANLGAIKVTISKFYRASGSSTQNQGVLSDVSMPFPDYEVGEKFYPNALPWDKIEKASYKEFNLIEPYVSSLKKASESRLIADPGFKEIKQLISEFEKKKNESSKISLKDLTLVKNAKQKSAAEKEKEIKEVKAAEKELTDANGQEPKLEDDSYLQESIKIAADYARLIQKKPLAPLEIVGLKPKVVKQTAKVKKEDAKVKAKVKANNK